MIMIENIVIYVCIYITQISDLGYLFTIVIID